MKTEFHEVDRVRPFEISAGKLYKSATYGGLVWLAVLVDNDMKMLCVASNPDSLLLAQPLAVRNAADLKGRVEPVEGSVTIHGDPHD